MKEICNIESGLTGANISYCHSVEIAFFWDMTPCSLVDIYQHFGRTYCLHLQSRKGNWTGRTVAGVLRGEQNLNQ
jgi:hypothetical protein